MSFGQSVSLYVALYLASVYHWVSKETRILDCSTYQANQEKTELTTLCICKERL